MQRFANFILLCIASCGVVQAADSLQVVKPDSAITVKRLQLERGHISTAIEVFSGNTAGVTIGNDQNSEAMLTSVRVRGNSSLTGGNEPLVIIDGMSSDLRTLSTIYPGDIENFTVLKDASQTAQYGSRGAAGVIEVTTKKGVQGQFSIGYSTDIGFVHADKFQPMLSAGEYRNLTQTLGLSIVDHGQNTDWQREIVRTGFVQNHHVAFGGAGNSSAYRVSLSYSQNNSIIPSIGNNAFTAKADVSQKAFHDRLSIDLGIFGSWQKNKYINDEQKLMYSAAAFNPTFRTGNAGGSFDTYADASQINNPESLLDILIHNSGLHFNTHARLSGDLGYGLKLTAYGSYSYTTNDRSRFYPTYLESTGKIYRGAGKTQTWLANMQLSYAYITTNHKVEASLLAEMQGSTTADFYTTVNRLSSNAFSYNNLSVGAMRLWDGTGSSSADQHMVSIMANASYTALSRYTIGVTARADASSLFGANNKWGFFPSVSASWNMKNETWVQDVSWLSTLQLKAGFGISGNQGGISPYNSLELLAPTGVVDIDGVPSVTLGIVRNANPDLKWEKKKTTNAGLEIGFLKNRFLLSADYYYSYISDMLYNYTVSVPPFMYDKLLANLGQMQNSGLEFGLGIGAVQTKDFTFNINLNLAWQQNKLLSLDGWYADQYLTAPQYTPIAGLNGAGLHGGFTDVVYQVVGQPLGVFYLPHCSGLEQQADGTMRYVIEDVDKDGTIDLSEGGDRRVCGQATPKVLLGSNFAFRYKQFDLTIQINGAFGHKIFNGSALTYNNLGSLPYYNVYKSAEEMNINDLTISDYWLERGDYLNIDYLTLGWTMNTEKTRVIKNLRVSLSVNNLATITGYSGLTPMINNSMIDSTLGVDDKRTLPVSRTYSVAFNIQF